MIKKQVNAFTILEVTIAMLVAAILIGFTYTAYSIVARSFGDYSRKNQDMANLVRLDEWLKKDFAHADSVQTDTGGIVLNSKDRHINYWFSPGEIIRTEVRADTFKLQQETILASFEEQPVNDENKLVDDLQLVILFQNEKIPYHYHKQYSSANLINRNPNALN